MKILRQTIRKILLEQMTEEEEMAEWRKYFKPQESLAAIKELGSIFEDTYTFRAGSFMNKFDIYEMFYKPEPGCVVRFRLYQMHGAIKFDEIETTPECEGRGYARHVIKTVQNIAGKHGVKIYLEPKAFHTHKGEGRMSSAELEKWYMSQGFKKSIHGFLDLEWKP